MIYILVLIGLILVYIGLKFEKKSNNREAFKTFIPGNADIDKIKEQEETIKYLSARMDDIESALLILNENMNEIKSMYQNANFQEKKLVIEDKEETPSFQKDIEINTKEADNRSDINKTIYELYDSGNSIEEIASKLRIGKGEVSLRLGLRK